MKNVCTIKRFFIYLKKKICPTARRLHKLEHLGNIIILTTVTFGAHEIESFISGGLALVLVWQLFINEEET